MPCVYARLNPIYLGDDLFSRQPVCEAVRAVDGRFKIRVRNRGSKSVPGIFSHADTGTLIHRF